MKIAVFGATGGTGKNVVERAVADGHQVTAVARRPEAIPPREGLAVKKGDVLDAESVVQAISGVDAVISAIGPAKNGAPGTLLSVGTKNLVEACERQGVRRLVMESGMICSDGSELSLLGRWAIGIFGAIYPKLRDDKRIAEATIAQSKLDWVIVRPPTLTHGPATGKYLVGPRMRILPAKGISHADCAEALIRAASEASWVKQYVNVGRA